MLHLGMVNALQADVRLANHFGVGVDGAHLFEAVGQGPGELTVTAPDL